MNQGESLKHLICSFPDTNKDLISKLNSCEPLHKIQPSKAVNSIIV